MLLIGNESSTTDLRSEYNKLKTITSVRALLSQATVNRRLSWGLPDATQLISGPATLDKLKSYSIPAF